MGRLSSPYRKQFSREDFEKYPVWVWDDKNEGKLPLSESATTIGAYGNFFIKAKFNAAGHPFDGYLVGENTFHAFGLFIENHVFSFNLRLTKFHEKNVMEICKLLNCKSFKLFPLHYESDVRFTDRDKIEGWLVP